jgi:hypothetical protein
LGSGERNSPEANLHERISDNAFYAYKKRWLRQPEIALLIDASVAFENLLAVVTQKVWVGFGQLIWQMNRLAFERNKILLQCWLWE